MPSDVDGRSTALLTIFFWSSATDKYKGFGIAWFALGRVELAYRTH